jgi:hypothetical protein
VVNSSHFNIYGIFEIFIGNIGKHIGEEAFFDEVPCQRISVLVL